MLPSIRNSERGFAALHTVLILAIAISILLALINLLPGQSAHESAASPPAPVSRPAAGGTLPPVRNAPRPAAGGADAANQRLDQLSELPLLHDLANLGYSRGSFTDPATYDDIKAKIEERYHVHIGEHYGLNYAIIKPKDPNDPRVYLSLGGSESTLDWLANFGQLLPRISTEQVVNKVQAGVRLNPVASMINSIASGVHYGLLQPTDWQYRGGLVIAEALARKYGHENVIVTGHSLGGGTASYISAMLGIRGVGFNAAPLGGAQTRDILAHGLNQNGEQFTNINADGEVVSTYPLFGQQIGEVITVQGKHNGITATFDNHGIGSIQLDQGVRYQPPKSIR